MKYIKEKLEFEKWIIGNLYKLRVNVVDQDRNMNVSGVIFIVKLESVNQNYGKFSGICVFPDLYKGRFMPTRSDELVKLSEPSKEEVDLYNLLMDARKYNL